MYRSNAVGATVPGMIDEPVRETNSRHPSAFVIRKKQLFLLAVKGLLVFLRNVKCIT